MYLLSLSRKHTNTSWSTARKTDTECLTCTAPTQRCSTRVSLCLLYISTHYSTTKPLNNSILITLKQKSNETSKKNGTSCTDHRTVCIANHHDHNHYSHICWLHFTINASDILRRYVIYTNVGIQFLHWNCILRCSRPMDVGREIIFLHPSTT